jgi:hypothetical protein
VVVPFLVLFLAWSIWSLGQIVRMQRGAQEIDLRIAALRLHQEADRADTRDFENGT